MRFKHILFATLCMATISNFTSNACTGLIVGKGASADGSVMISYAADSHSLYGQLVTYPAAKHAPGEMLQVTEWDTSKPLGKIAQVEQTYSVIGNMNEHQVAITESTWGGREELVDSTGIIDYGSLIFITLQRSKSAREAIKIMTDLVSEYGYYSEGESFSIADKNEVWVMDMIGKGPGNTGAIWVAIRIPDDCISGHANNPRIHKLPLDDKENCIYSPDVISFARSKGYFNGKDKDFDFAKAYAEQDFSAIRGCDARVWSWLRKFDPSMDQYLEYVLGDSSKEAFPLYIKPNRKVTVHDVQNAMRDHYEGTPLDMTKDAGAGTYDVPYRWRPLTFKVDSVEYTNERAIATQQTGFVIVPQMRNWLPDAIGGILWFGVDDADMAVFTPMYCSITSIPECYRQGNGDMNTFSWTSAFWIHNWVANMAYSKYSYMIKDIRPVQIELEESYLKQTAELEKEALKLYESNPASAIALLNKYSNITAEKATARWKSLGEYLLVKYMDGNVKKEKDGKFIRNKWGYPEYPTFPGYDEDFYKAIVKDHGDFLKVTK